MLDPHLFVSVLVIFPQFLSLVPPSAAPHSVDYSCQFPMSLITSTEVIGQSFPSHPYQLLVSSVSCHCWFGCLSSCCLTCFLLARLISLLYSSSPSLRVFSLHLGPPPQINHDWLIHSKTSFDVCLDASFNWLAVDLRKS
ncbi:hypothetical protein GOODEAATRI_005418 [Goodea atripinnis]|uniref:Secreted protein n=1 Tax=Goodea atripinnis TaxID=208336 RepID=A0ABV0P1N1_9TELE